MYEQNCALKDGTPLTGVKKSQETAKPHCKELIEKKNQKIQVMPRENNLTEQENAQFCLWICEFQKSYFKTN